MDPLEGFQFTVLGGSYVAPRLQLGIEQRQMLQAWCQLQTSVPDYNGEVDGGCGPLVGYACVPNGTTMCSSGGSCTVTTCDNMVLPLSPASGLCSTNGADCPCTATSCGFMLSGMGDVRFDLQLTSTLDGSVTGLAGGNVFNVHLTKGP